MRGSKYLEAGSRNKYTSAKIPFTYEALKDDMAQAIDKLEANGATVVDEAKENVFEEQSEKVDFTATMKEIRSIAKALKDADEFEKYTDVTTRYLGKNKNVRDCDETQVDILGLILSDLKDLVNELGIVM